MKKEELVWPTKMLHPPAVNIESGVGELTLKQQTRAAARPLPSSSLPGQTDKTKLNGRNSRILLDRRTSRFGEASADCKPDYDNATRR